MKRNEQPLVSLAVLNWNGLEDTKSCLVSLRALNYPNIEIIVVDNGSVDGSKDYFATLNDIVFVDLPYNTGFTGGHIAAEQVAKGRYIGLINNDLVIDSDWINECLATFDRNSKAAMVGGKTFKWNGDNPVYDVSNEFYSFQEVDIRTGNTRTLLVGDPVDQIADSFGNFFQKQNVFVRLSIHTKWDF